MDSKRPLNLLCVEDAPDDVELIRIALRRHHYEPFLFRVDTAEDMKRALAERRWDAITVDYRMPRFDAGKALAIRNEFDPDLPLIIVSSSIGEDMAVAAMKSGASDYVMKQNLVRLGPAVDRECAESKIRRDKRRAEEEKARLITELKQAVEFRDEFLTLASHELRTPTTVLQLNIEAALRTVDREVAANGVRGKLERAQKQVLRLAELIGMLVDVPNFASGLRALSTVEADLETVVRAAVAPFVELAERHGSRIEINLERGVIGKFDPVQLTALVRHLLSNAVKFGPEKPIGVTLRREADKAVLEVRDQGIGVAIYDQKRIFERFERAVPAEHYGGFGLGLWLSRQIAEAHGGRIDVQSTPGEGSTFAVQLPIRR